MQKWSRTDYMGDEGLKAWTSPEAVLRQLEMSVRLKEGRDDGPERTALSFYKMTCVPDRGTLAMPAESR